MDPEGREMPARAAGRVFASSQPLPGDLVQARAEGETLLVEDVLPRRNTLTRADRKGEPRELAANIDLVLAVMAVLRPEFSPGLLDRILAAAEWDRLSAVVVLNKTDLAADSGGRQPARLLEDYRAAGYTCLPASCNTGLGIDGIAELTGGRVVMMTGPSGAGKTSIARRLRPDLDLKVGGLSPRTSRGRHTTTSSRLVHLGRGAFLMDTPGIQGCSVGHIPAGGLGECFPEIRRLSDSCRFRDCYHHKEPGCAVRSAVAEGAVPEGRYRSYLELLERVRG
jgi:ribosome biogenesis GTPase